MTAPAELHFLELHELSRLLRSGKLSPVEVTLAQLDRIERLDPALHSYACVTAELALEQAKKAERELQQGFYRSPLQGIPIGLKDLVMTAGIPTAAGMAIHRNRVPTEDATLVTRLREAGSVFLGKLQMTEGAFAIHHPEFAAPLNPWHADHWCGASSSGSGVATAAGLCYAAIGTDSGGSIRFPCAANGLTGIKPTWGRVSRYGICELAASLDHVGPIARSARDAMLLLSAIAGHDPRDPTSLSSACLEIPEIELSFRDLSIGIDEHWLSADVDPVIQRALQQVMELVESLGGTLCPVTVPDTRAVSAAWERHCGVQTALAHAATYPARAAEYGPALSRLIDGGLAMSGVEYQQILLDAMAFSGAMDTLLDRIDLLLAPVQPVAAPTYAQLGALAQDPEANRQLIQYTSPFNVSGHPAISLPCGFTEQGLPIGCQFIAGKQQEVLLARAGMALQSVTDWHQRHPQCAPTNA